MTPSTNKAAILSSFTSPLTLESVPIPSPTLGSAVIKVLATYIPPYAKNVYNGTFNFNLPLPLSPGLGAIARIHALGPDATSLSPNDLVFFDPTVTSRTDPQVVLLQGHFEGLHPAGRALMEGAWRHGTLCEYTRVPLENCVRVDEGRLVRELGYDAADLATLFPYFVAAGPLFEVAEVKAGQTVVVGPATGAYSGAAVEVAGAMGADVVALGRNEGKLKKLVERVGRKNVRCVVMSGDDGKDAEALRRAIPNGVDVYNDWSPGGSDAPIFLKNIGGLLKRGARVVLSGGAMSTSGLSHAIMVVNDIRMEGKFMYNRTTVKRVFDLVSLGLLEIGERSGTTVRRYKLDDVHQALDSAEELGAWKSYVVVTPSN